MHGYRDVIAIREVWTTLLLAALIRIPIFSLGIVMSVHVVSSLHLDYVRAGAVTTVVTVATMISGPWRGSMVDRRGLRRTMLPSLITTTIAWGLCPWLGTSLFSCCARSAGCGITPSSPSRVRSLWRLCLRHDVARHCHSIL
ncbi:membrane protein [Cutibacterium acnes JCM 18916]|nr:membrane protein [Cutibacterium acnes JCM 18916]GAE78194.1 membrane protein [Cutibacterium acnes JCM 18918]